MTLSSEQDNDLPLFSRTPDTPAISRAGHPSFSSALHCGMWEGRGASHGCCGDTLLFSIKYNVKRLSHTVTVLQEIF
ncbi:hypothetical protein DPEC_G00240540 [Dallia pectoralis]|uniref:Uncharacterized protein n=1 Tax=Dallia pectoralis TaxID=75939 RepID=A0ACC2FZK4_DALPE|nr:hypothetical protein DPEC_G00240540 [Dallia pectoralis]